MRLPVSPLQTHIDPYAPQNRSMDKGMGEQEAGSMAGGKHGMEVEAMWVDTGKKESMDRQTSGWVDG